METILNTIKKLLGIQQEYEYFDEDIMIHINTAFATLNQLGVGPAEGFYMDDKTALWDDYITSINMQMIKSYIYLKVRILFDPPTSSVLMDSMNRSIAELEWRLYLEGDREAEDSSTSGSDKY